MDNEKRVDFYRDNEGETHMKVSSIPGLDSTYAENNSKKKHIFGKVLFAIAIIFILAVTLYSALAIDSVTFNNTIQIKITNATVSILFNNITSNVFPNSPFDYNISYVDTWNYNRTDVCTNYLYNLSCPAPVLNLTCPALNQSDIVASVISGVGNVSALNSSELRSLMVTLNQDTISAFTTKFAIMDEMQVRLTEKDKQLYDMNITVIQWQQQVALEQEKTKAADLRSTEYMIGFIICAVLVLLMLFIMLGGTSLFEMRGRNFLGGKGGV